MVSSRTPDANVTSTADGGAANDGGAASSRDDEGRATNDVDREWSQSGPASLSMPTDLRNLVISHLSDSGRYSSASPDHHQETTSDVATIKIGCHDEEESYEAFGSVEGDSVDDGPDSPGDSSSAPSPTGTNSRRNPRSPNSTVGRHSWLRTSLRRTPPCSSRKRLSSNALARSKRSIFLNLSSMCATRSRRPFSDANRDPDRNHQHPAVQAPHLGPHPFYLPPPYARYPPCDPYAAYHCQGSFYPPPCYAQRDIIKEEPVAWSWPVILFFILLVIVSIGVIYRTFSRDARRKLAAWLRLHRLQPQTVRTETKQDVTRNCSAEFHRCNERNEDRRVSRENRDESTSLTDTTITRSFVNPDYEEDDDDDRYGSENEESNRDAIFMRPGSIHRILNLKF